MIKGKFYCFGWDHDDSDFCHDCRDDEECRKATNEMRESCDICAKGES